jgi:hypothetical protein
MNDDKPRCKCLTADKDGRYCNLDVYYMKNFYDKYYSVFNEISNNYTSYSNINTNIKSLYSTLIFWISESIDFLHNNYIDFPSIAPSFVE